MIYTPSGRRSRSGVAAAALSVPDHVVLGMVGLGARSGYEIKQAVEQSIRFFWTISQAQIYPSLARLERAGLLAGASDPQGNRPRRVYQLTASGHAELVRWLTDGEPMPFELRDHGMLKLFFADVLDRDQAREVLRTVRARSAERIRVLRAIEPAAQEAEATGSYYPALTLRLGLAYHQAIIDVCDNFESRWPTPGPS
jgi:PadR family transcriptional regulator AphA